MYCIAWTCSVSLHRSVLYLVFHRSAYHFHCSISRLPSPSQLKFPIVHLLLSYNDMSLSRRREIQFYVSGKFSNLTKFWISFKFQLIDPKFHGDHEYLVYLVDSLMVKALSLTSGILPGNLHETSKWALFFELFSRFQARFKQIKGHCSTYISM